MFLPVVGGCWVDWVLVVWCVVMCEVLSLCCKLLLGVQVHDLAVGKYCSELSGFLELNSSVFLMKVGQL